MAQAQKSVGDGLLCPSAPARVGALIIGVVGADGSVSYVKDRITATPEFIDIVQTGRDAEERFRFSSPCQQAGCCQWVNGECSLPERVSELVPHSESSTLPHCSIRPRCRWYHQNGSEACRICPVVVTRDRGTMRADNNPKGGQHGGPSITKW